MEQITYKGTDYEIRDFGLASKFYRECDVDGRHACSAPIEAEVEICQDWLRQFATRRKTANKRIGSYGLKHVVERWAKVYVSNGAFILAAYRAGFKLTPHCPDSPNCWINASFKAGALDRMGSENTTACEERMQLMLAYCSREG